MIPIAPADIDVASSERDVWPIALRSVRPMWQSLGRADYSRRESRRGTKDLAVNAGGGCTPGLQGGRKIIHEHGRPAKVVVGIARQVQLPERARIQSSRGIKIDGKAVRGTRRTVADVPTAFRQRRKERSRFLGERMLAAVPRAVDPPNVSRRTLCDQSVRAWRAPASLRHRHS